MQDLKIIFLGTPEFAVHSLSILVDNGWNVVAAITATDKLGGRGGKKLLESPVKKYAVSNNIPVLQPKNLKNIDFIAEVKSYNADLQVVVAFRMLPEVIWKMPRLGTINLHGSLLPSYRGAAPIHWAVINGETITGVTSFKLKHEIDTGNIIFQEKLKIEEDDTTGKVHDKMMILGAEVILKTVNAISTGEFPLLVQDLSKISKAPKLDNSTCKIDFNQSTIQVYNFVRGLSPFPCAWTEINGVNFKFYFAEMELFEHNIEPGKVICDNKSYLKILCTDGAVSIIDLKMEGKKRMNIKDFLNGYTMRLSS